MSGCTKEHPDHSKLLHRLNRIQGQVTGVKRMIEERRYCPEIMIQIDATRTALASLQDALLAEHLQHCVAETFNSKDRNKAEAKMEELLELFRRRRL